VEVESHKKEDPEQVEVELQIQVDLEMFLQQILLKETQVVEMVVETQTITELVVEEELVVQVNKYLQVFLIQVYMAVMVDLAQQQVLQVHQSQELAVVAAEIDNKVLLNQTEHLVQEDQEVEEDRLILQVLVQGK
tara:strand:- start:323 stop:727 length:405 start_codon:yes stop_codon:yes gene_type:complete